MANLILKNVPLYYARLDKPNAKFDKTNPKWEVQFQTEDADQAAEWKEAGLKPKFAEPKEAGGKPYYKVTVRRSSIKQSGELHEPPKVIDGRLQQIAANSVGNGSIGNVKLWEYEGIDNVTKKPTKRFTLMAVQIIHHKVYIPSDHNDEDDFEEAETTIELPEGALAKF
jgi:hypothetical protein